MKFLHLGTHRVDQIPNIVNSYFGFASSNPKLISPDELVIQQRGRRVLPIVFSPDIDTIKQVCLCLYCVICVVSHMKKQSFCKNKTKLTT